MASIWGSGAGWSPVPATGYFTDQGRSRQRVFRTENKKKAGRKTGPPFGYCDEEGDYGVTLVPMYGATPGVQPVAPAGQTGVPPTGPIVEPTPTGAEQPLPSHAAS